MDEKTDGQRAKKSKSVLIADTTNTLWAYNFNTWGLKT